MEPEGNVALPSPPAVVFGGATAGIDRRETRAADKIGFGEKVALGSGYLAIFYGNSGVKSLAIPVYQMVLGVNPAVLGLVLAIPRFWDAQARLGYVPSEDESVEVGMLLSSDSINRSLVEADPQDTKTDSKETGFQRYYLSYQRS